MGCRACMNILRILFIQWEKRELWAVMVERRYWGYLINGCESPSQIRKDRIKIASYEYDLSRHIPLLLCSMNVDMESDSVVVLREIMSA
jgi:hypothetical protein